MAVGIYRKQSLRSITTTSTTPLGVSLSGGGTYERGFVVPSVNLSWSYNSGNVDPNNFQTLNNGIGSLPLNVRNYTYNTPTTTNKTFSINANDTVKGSAASSTSINFISKRYWGATNVFPITESEIKNYNSELDESNAKDVIFNCSGGKYFFFAYPASSPALTTNTTVNNFPFSDWSDNAGNSTQDGSLMNITNQYGVTTSYRIYICFNLQNGSAISVKFRG